jgi:hypothetical protein
MKGKLSAWEIAAVIFVTFLRWAVISAGVFLFMLVVAALIKYIKG